MKTSLDDIYSSTPLELEEFYAITDEIGEIHSPDLLYDIVSGLGLSDSSVIVDAGCGGGRHSVALVEHTNSMLVAFDPVGRNFRNTRAALTMAGYSGHSITTAARIEAIPLPAGTVDLMFARDMLNHVPDLLLTLTECRRVVKAGGHMLVFTVFATERLYPSEAEEIFPPLMVQPRTTNRDWFEAAAAQAGLAIVRREKVGSQWREWGEINGDGRTTAQLLRIARLRRREQEIVARTGQTLYEIELADCLWGVYQMLGKLEPYVYLLRASEDRG